MNVTEYLPQNRRSSCRRNEFFRKAELREAQEKVIFRQRIRASQSSAFRFIWAFFVWTHPYVDCYKRIGL
jgi:hypothetical protein